MDNMTLDDLVDQLTQDGTAAVDQLLADRLDPDDLDQLVRLGAAAVADLVGRTPGVPAETR